MRKTPLKKRVTRSLKPRSNVDPTRVALQAIERIRTVLVSSGHQERLGDPLSMKELVAQGQLLGMELPPSYVAAMRVASKIGEPEVFLLASEMKTEAARLVKQGGEESQRYAPFCRGSGVLVCFDRGTAKTAAEPNQGELTIVEWRDDGSANPVAAHFGEWLDLIADVREESIESAAQMPQRLKRLLYELGFRFQYPVVGRLETGDVAAIEELIGPTLARTVRGEADRLFDSSGKASLTLNVDEFTLAASLRTGIYVFEAEDVFRWLRYFRDENFFSDTVTVPHHPDNVRDLRRAARESPLVLRGVAQVPVLPAPNHTFRTASGASADDFYVLARTPSTSERAPTQVIHIVGGVVATTHKIDEPLNDLYVSPEGEMWGLTATHVVRFGNGRSAETFALARPTPGRPWWYGIGGGGHRVLVWGAGSLLEFDGRRFVAFEPDAMLHESESVIALASHGLRVSMLVCGDQMGAVARFDSVEWQPITEDQVIEAALADLDFWRGTAWVLGRDGTLWAVDRGPPRRADLPLRHEAFRTEAGTPRPVHGVRAHDDGVLLASDGGVVAISLAAAGGGGPPREPIFHAAPGGARDPVRLVRLGTTSTSGGPEAPAKGAPQREIGIVAVSGPHVWLWKDGAFSVVDMRHI